MQNSIKAIAATSVISFLLSTNALAQEAYSSTTAKEIHSPIMAVDAKTIVNISNDDIMAKYPLVTTAFSTLFPVATNTQWSSSNDNCWVSFLNKGRKSRASFTSKAELNYVISDCSMDQLPSTMSGIIKKDYPSYQLFNAIEIKAHNTLAYQVVLENSINFLTLKYTGEGMEQISQMNKTNK